MPYVLLTGMSGAGKSTVLAELARPGHRVVETDDGWCRPDGDWDEHRIADLLAQDVPDTVYVAGCEQDQGGSTTASSRSCC